MKKKKISQTRVFFSHNRARCEPFTSNISIRTSSFPILFMSHDCFPSHHHRSMLLFDFIQQTDSSLFGILEIYVRLSRFEEI